jgi:hypothetical protein
MRLDQKMHSLPPVEPSIPYSRHSPNGAIQILDGPGFRWSRFWAAKRDKPSHLAQDGSRSATRRLVRRVNDLVLLYHGMKLRRDTACVEGWCTTDPDARLFHAADLTTVRCHALPLKFHPAVISIRVPAFEAPSGASVPVNKIARYRSIF